MSGRVPRRSAATGTDARTTHLLLILNGGPFASIELGEEPIDIGRAEGCAVRLDVPSLSRHHATIEWNGETHVLTDLQSSNGTRVNGARVTKHALGHRDRIALGDALFTYRLIEK
jgi:pSer/pThr/pTyr-binding forkhead associated (FHA) protein